MVRHLLVVVPEGSIQILLDMFEKFKYQYFIQNLYEIYSIHVVKSFFEKQEDWKILNTKSQGIGID